MPPRKRIGDELQGPSPKVRRVYRRKGVEPSRWTRRKNADAASVGVDAMHKKDNERKKKYRLFKRHCEWQEKLLDKLYKTHHIPQLPGSAAHTQLAHQTGSGPSAQLPMVATVGYSPTGGPQPKSEYDPSHSTLANSKGHEAIIKNAPTVFQHPMRTVISGPSCSGKTVFVQRLLEHRMKMIYPPPDEVMWFYGTENAIIKIRQDHPEISFHKGLPSFNALMNLKDGVKRLIICDDLMSANKKDDSIMKLFTQGSHHKDMSVIYIVQNLFDKSATMTTISRNASHMVLFKNQRDKQQIMTLGTQIMGRGESDFLMWAYKDAIKRPYGYLLLDLTQQADESTQFRALIFPEEDNTYYVKAGTDREALSKLPDRQGEGRSAQKATRSLWDEPGGARNTEGGVAEAELNPNK